MYRREWPVRVGFCIETTIIGQYRTAVGVYTVITFNGYRDPQIEGQEKESDPTRGVRKGFLVVARLN